MIHSLKSKLIFGLFSIFVGVANASVDHGIAAPVPGNLDPRVVTYAYTPHVVYSLHVTVGMHTHIPLAQDEELTEVPRIGDKIRWRIEGNERNLYIKATAPNTRTSLSVVTSRRIYQFELIATNNPEERVQKAIFSYPDEEEKIAIRQANVMAAQLERIQNEAHRLNSQNIAPEPIDPVNLRFLTVRSSDARYAAMHAYTDGVRTYLRLPPGVQDLPAVFMSETNERGKEMLMPVNYTVADRNSVLDRDAIIIDRTADVWVLQVGQKVQVRITEK